MNTPERDFTTMKSKLMPTEVCPKCGRMGVRRHYPKGDFDLISHKAKLCGIFWEVTDSCIIKKEK